MTVLAIGTGRAVEVLHDRGSVTSAGGDRWTGGSGYLIGSGLVLTAAHNVDYRRDLGGDEQLLVRTIEGNLLAARVVLVCDEMSRADLALLEISDPRFGEQLPLVTFARVDRDSPAPITGCWAVGFPRFGEASPVLPGGSRRETWQVSGHILPGGKRRAGLLSLQVTSTPWGSLAGSAWEGMSGAVVFAADAHDGEQAAVGVISTHHRPEGESALTVVPVTAVAELAAAARWWRRFGVPGPDTLLILPRQRARAGLVRPTSAAGRPLEEVTDPFALEVHRPVQPEDAPPGQPVLPTYVPREHDQLLSRVVRAAAEGRSGIAVLVGGSSTGKTRACWEALALLRDRDPPWRLWHPIDPSRPDAALQELEGVGPRTVVWLNEAQFYLDPTEAGLGERVAAGLRQLLRDPGRAPVLVLATLWPQFWDTVTARPSGGNDRHAQARELLAGHDITVPAAFTPGQMGQFARAADARMVLAARSAPDGQVIQFLAGAPELLARYRHAPPAAAALIDAAMDARRLGMGAALPQAFLEAAAPGYLTDDQWDALGEDWLEQALAYTAVPAKGARGPLTRIRPRLPARHRGDQPGGTAAAAGPLYRLADYLDQHGRARRAGQIPPPEFWAAAAAHAAPGDQAALGDAAHDRGLYRDAAQLHKNAAASGNLSAALYLSRPPACLRADPRPAHWAADHAALDDPARVVDLLGTLGNAGAHEALASRAAAHDPLDDLGNVVRLLDRLRNADAHAALASRAVAHAPLDDPGDVGDLLKRLRKAGAQPKAAALLARDPAAHAALADPYGLARLLDSLREAGADEQAAALLARDPAGHAALDDPAGVALLLDSLREAGADEQAAALASRAAAHATLDNPGGVARLLDSLRKAGADEQATAVASRVAVDNPNVVSSLLDSLWWAGAGEQAAALLARDPAGHAALDNPGAVTALLNSLRKAGAHEQAAALAARVAAHAPLENRGKVIRLLDTLRKAGAREQAAALASRAAAHATLADPAGVALLLDTLRKADTREQAAALLARDPAGHAALDDPGAVALLLDRLREAGADEQAAALLARDPAGHAALDDPGAVARLLRALREAGADEQAAALLARDPAGHAALDDPGAVARLLRALREAGADEQAAALLARDPAGHAALDDPGAVALLLDRLREAGADEQAAALLARDPAGHAALDGAGMGMHNLLHRAAGELTFALACRLPAAGRFEDFLELQGPQDQFCFSLNLQGSADQFRFGREADGTPAAPWGWEDLDLWLVPRPQGTVSRPCLSAYRRPAESAR